MEGAGLLIRLREIHPYVAFSPTEHFNSMKTESRVYRICYSQVRQGWANLRDEKLVTMFVPLLNSNREFYSQPDQVIFQWQSDYKKRPDIINPIGSYPIVSERFKDFIVGQNFSGVQFFPALVVPAGKPSSIPAADGSEAAWWVMTPMTKCLIDEFEYCGPKSVLCPETGAVIIDGRMANPNDYLGQIVPTEMPESEFFGVKNLNPLRVYCLEEVAEKLRRKNFKALILDETGFLKY